MAGDGDSDSESGRSFERDEKTGRFCKKGSEGALKGRFRKKRPAARAGELDSSVGEKRPATRAGGGNRVGEKRPATRAGGRTRVRDSHRAMDLHATRWIRARRVNARVSSSGEDSVVEVKHRREETVSDLDSHSGGRGGDLDSHSGSSDDNSNGRRMRKAPAAHEGGEGTSRWMHSSGCSDTSECRIEENRKQIPLIDLTSSSEDAKGKKVASSSSEGAKGKKQQKAKKEQQKKQQKAKKAKFDDRVEKIWALNEEIETLEAKIEGLVDELSKAHAKKKKLQHKMEEEQRKASKPFRVEV
ncbi:unnamed protein product [Urochloa humidicola]